MPALRGDDVGKEMVMSERGTCRYEPETIGFTWFDDDDVEHFEEDSASEDCMACECSECGCAMLCGDCGWFSGWDEPVSTTDEDGVEHRRYVMTPLFDYCPYCGRKVLK